MTVRKITPRVTALAVVLGAASAAWAGGDVPPATQAPMAFGSLAPRMSVPEPSYRDGSGHLALFRSVNALRLSLGVGLLASWSFKTAALPGG